MWQKAKELTLLMHKYTEGFPKSEEYGIRGQLRRATVSAVLTIVDGHRRASRKEFVHYLNCQSAPSQRLKPPGNYAWS